MLSRPTHAHSQANAHFEPGGGYGEGGGGGEGGGDIGEGGGGGVAHVTDLYDHAPGSEVHETLVPP